MTALHLLAIKNDYEMMSRFLKTKDLWSKAKLELGLKDVLGRNPCDIAIELGHQQMLELLMKHGAHPSHVGLQLQGALSKKAGYTQVHRPKPNVQSWSMLDCIEQNNIDRFQSSILLGENVNQMDGKGRSALHLAVIYERETIMMTLLKQSAAVNS